MAHVDTETARRLRRAAGHLERWHAERDELIRQAHAEGMGVREIARQVGMTHPGVLAILARQYEVVDGPLMDEATSRVTNVLKQDT